MKKIVLALGVLFCLFIAQNTFAEETDSVNSETTTEQVKESIPSEDLATLQEEEEASTHQIFKEKFIEGGWQWMTPILICLILGLAVSFERILYLNLATSNSKKLLQDVETALNNNVNEAIEVCSKVKGPVASLFGQGLERVGEGIHVVEKSLEATGSVQMSRMERGMSWVSLFIAIAPMLGFMGTVIGMIQSFDVISEAAGNAPASQIAEGIKVALITTVFGLIVAVILQFAYNYLVAKIDSMVHDMEASSISFIDILVKKGYK